MSTTVNPFTGQGTVTPMIPVPGFLRDAGYYLQGILMDASRAVTQGDRPWAAITAFAVAVLFGVIHIIGPGHGKIFTIGYFGSRRSRLREGLLLSALVNLLDSLSAFLMVGIVYGVLSLSVRSAGASTDRIMKMVAYGAVALMGALNLISHLRSHRKHEHVTGNSPTDVEENRSTHSGSGETTQLSTPKKKGMRPWMLALSVGLIPCPVSSAILTWGIVNQSLGFCIFLVLGVSIGGMIAMTAFSFALIGGKMGLTRILQKKHLERALVGFETAAMIFLVVVGILLFLTTL